MTLKDQAHGPYKTPQQLQAQKNRFLRAVERFGTLTAGCKAARVSPHTVYEWREQDIEFTIREHEARERCADELEAVVLKRAKKRSDILAIFLLKAMRPERFRERYEISHSPSEILLKPIVIDDLALLEPGQQP